MKAKSNSELVICDGAYTELMMQENWLYESHEVEAGGFCQKPSGPQPAAHGPLPTACGPRPTAHGPRPTAQSRNGLTARRPGSLRQPGY